MNHLPHWWQNGVIYQIYPKSFQDTTGSGTVDAAVSPEFADLFQLGAHRRILPAERNGPSPARTMWR